MKCSSCIGAALAMAVVGWTAFLHAGTPEGYRKQWNDPAVKQRIAAGIEKNRKQDAQLELRMADGKPAAGAKVEIVQTGHEFLFGCNAFVLGQLDTPEKKEV